MRFSYAIKTDEIFDTHTKVGAGNWLGADGKILGRNPICLIFRLYRRNIENDRVLDEYTGLFWNLNGIDAGMFLEIDTLTVIFFSCFLRHERGKSNKGERSWRSPGTTIARPTERHAPNATTC